MPEPVLVSRSRAAGSPSLSISRPETPNMCYLFDGARKMVLMGLVLGINNGNGNNLPDCNANQTTPLL